MPWRKPDRSGHYGDLYSRQGARRPYVTVAAGWAPVLTKRQMTASGARYRARVARQWGRMFQIMDGAHLTMQEFVEGLSSEELANGRLKDHRGMFSGQAPQWVPREFHQACIRELLSRGATLYRENYVEAIKTMTSIANDKRVKPGDRIKAAQFVIERLEGKVPERLEITTDAPWQAAMNRSRVRARPWCPPGRTFWTQTLLRKKRNPARCRVASAVPSGPRCAATGGGNA